MLYLKSFQFLDWRTDERFINDILETYHSSYYPFAFFPDMGLEQLSFEPITLLCGGNGSGKTTALNVIAEKLAAKRSAPFNVSPLFPDYVRLCRYERDPRCIRDFPAEIITSDDVFDFIFNLRGFNEGVDGRRKELVDRWYALRGAEPDGFQLRSMDDYFALADRNKRRKSTKSAYVRDNLSANIRTHSNGESALMYFPSRIRPGGLYLMDEPENSLSADSQKKLALILENACRFDECQFIISTHSPFLQSLRGAKLYDLDRRPVAPVHWTELENVRTLHDFFCEHDGEFVPHGEETE